MGTAHPTLYCPVRGPLITTARSKDGLKFTEEKRRIDCIRFLMSKGYEANNFQIETTLARFGNSGRNSFRTDLVVFDRDKREFIGSSLDEQRNHILLFGEIKRDNKEATEAKEYQVKAALNFLPNTRSLGVYWDDIEQRIFYKKQFGSRQQVIEAPLNYLPTYGTPLHVTNLRYNDLEILPELLPLFRRMEDSIHPYVSDIQVRYEFLLQILLTKIFDEGKNRTTNSEITVQDFTLFEDITDADVERRFNILLSRALGVYQTYLPKQISNQFEVSGTLLREISKYIAPINLLESNPEAIQNFYMYFAKQLYKWNLAQYFTPYEVVDFIVRIINPQYGDTIKDPACGSADFLVSAHRLGSKYDPKIGERIFGADNSANAVQISILNMLLNGDGKSNIKHEDSLEKVHLYSDRFSVLLCNPPFGVQIKEKRATILKHFDLGREYTEQQTGILFTELCIRQTKPGGRIAIIVPNGYLGNKSGNYVEFRKWILRHTKVVCVIGFPRFTFKKSGADVSASVLVLEKRQHPLEDVQTTTSYPVFVDLLNSVGWDIGNKQAKKVFKHEIKNGALILDKDTNNPILDADFDTVLNNLYSSPVISAFPWLATNIPGAEITDGWAISSEIITNDPYCLLDPKRLCRKYRELVETIKSQDHFPLTEICEILPEGWIGKRNSESYRYVELGNVFDNGLYEWQELRGWQLPGRAKHLAQPGDVFIGSVWGSVKKWFIAGADAVDNKLVATNGFYRLRIRPENQDLLPDLIFALSSEFYRVQMRALATGSDGLALISEDDLRFIVIPKLTDNSIRSQVQEFLRLTARDTINLTAMVRNSLTQINTHLDVPQRKTNFVQV
jgi:type I restriction enzyme M protein